MQGPNSRGEAWSIDLAFTFYEAMLNDMCSSLTTYTSDMRRSDTRLIRTRLRNEGITFAVSTLSQLGRAFNAALVTGEPMITPTAFRKKAESALPCFLYSLFRVVLNDSGDLRAELRYVVDWPKEAGLVIRAIRQITLAFSKLEMVTDIDPALYDEWAERVGFDGYRVFTFDLDEVNGVDAMSDCQLRMLMEGYLGEIRRTRLVESARRALAQLFRDGRSSDRVSPQTPAIAGSTLAISGATGQELSSRDPQVD